MKQLFLLPITVLLLILFYPTETYSNSDSSDWQLYHESEDVRIEFKKADCDLPSMGYHHVYKYLRFTNLTNSELQVTYDKTLWYNDKCLTCDNSPENRFTVSLKPNEQKQGECEARADRSLHIFHSMIKPSNPSILTRFELRNISVDSVR